MSPKSYPDAKDVDVDFGSLLGVIWQAKSRIIVFTLVVVGLAFIWTNAVKPRYASEARILIESGETSFTRPKDAPPVDDSKSMLDEQAVASQVQVISSRDLARLVVRKLELGKSPEFDSALDGISILKQVFVTIGLARDPLQMSAEERVLKKYFKRLSVYQVGKSRVIAVEFEASTPELAARITNAIADEYVSWQQNAKRENTKDAAAWLESEIAGLREKVAEAEARVAEFRSGSDLLVGRNNTSLNAQQLSDLNTELARIRAEKSDAQAKAQEVRAVLQTGRPLDASSDVMNSPLIQRLQERYVRLQARVAEMSSTLLPGHPRIKEMKAQLADLRSQIRGEGARYLRNLENDARIAAAREESLVQELSTIKAAASRANEQEVQLRALEREAKAQRDLLESFLARYREATARQNADNLPADARIISRAAPASEPAFPKKIPTLLAALFGALILGILAVLMRALTVTNTLPIRRGAVPPMPSVPGEIPIDGHVTLDDDHSPPMFSEFDAAEAAYDADNADSDAFASPEDGSLWSDEEDGADEMPIAPVTLRPIRSISDLYGRICSAAGGRGARTIAVAGADDAIGVASTATALARVMAMRGRRVVLVDVDPSRPQIAPLVAVTDQPGIGELLRGEASFGQVIFRDRASRAHVITAGRGVLLSPDQVDTEAFSAVIEALRQTYDHVIFGAGTVDTGTAAAIAARAEFTVLAVSGNANDPASIRAYDALAAVCLGEIAVVSTDPTTNGHRRTGVEPAEAA